jgi:diphosphoinositol-polyphosphate diphosphatase
MAPSVSVDEDAGEGEEGEGEPPGGARGDERGDERGDGRDVVVPRASARANGEGESPSSGPEEAWMGGEGEAETAANAGMMRARTGRANQRYNEANQRLVAGCICYRDVTAVEDSATGLTTATSAGTRRRVEVLMLTSRKGARVDGRDLIFPKGGWELDETAAEAAARESMEEGGVAGEVSAECERYEFVSASRLEAGAEGEESKCVARVFTMKVKTEYANWPEMGVRTRHWLTPEDAWRRCKHDWMRRALVDCARLDVSKAVVAADSL